jgi:hypothetical protein
MPLIMCQDTNPLLPYYRSNTAIIRNSFTRTKANEGKRFREQLGIVLAAKFSEP